MLLSYVLSDSVASAPELAPLPKLTLWWILTLGVPLLFIPISAVYASQHGYQFKRTDVVIKGDLIFIGFTAVLASLGEFLMADPSSFATVIVMLWNILLLVVVVLTYLHCIEVRDWGRKIKGQDTRLRYGFATFFLAYTTAIALSIFAILEPF
jgi:hypothetical protein